MFLGIGVVEAAITLATLGMIAYFLFRKKDPTRQSPLEILNERYAKGEIDREEYERMRRDMEG